MNVELVSRIVCPATTQKTRLTYNFLEYTVHYYIDLKKNLAEKLDSISKQGVKRVVFYGAGDVMEVAFVISHEANIELLGIIDDDKAKQGTKKFNFIIGGPETIPGLKPDAIIITSMRYKDKIAKRINGDAALAKIPVHGL